MKLKIELSKQGNFIMAILLVYFVFFGFICNVYEENIGTNLLFLYQVLFHPQSFLSLVLLMAIIFFMVFREEFFEYGIRNSFWLTWITILISWVWYWFTHEYRFDFLAWYFIRLETYITIVTILCINILTAIIASIAKEKYKAYKERIMRIEI
jgi:hypothetical protein